MPPAKIQPFLSDHADFLRDESRRTGKAESISFPNNEDEVRQIVRELGKTGTPTTIQGARTGIAAGAVPDGGHVLNLSRMNRIRSLRRMSESEGPGFLMRVQPGVTLQEIRDGLETGIFDTTGWSDDSLAALEEMKKAGPHFFPPDLTETTASIGGMVSTNASGARSFFYGATRPHIQRLSLVLADGEQVWLERGGQTAEGLSFLLQLTSGKTLEGILPDYPMPDVKSAAGYWVRPDMELIDLIIGAEGSLGIVTQMDLRLLPAPAYRWGFTAFLKNEENALCYVRSLRGEKVRGVDVKGEVRPTAIEFFNSGALDLLRRQKAENPAFSYLPQMPEEYHTAVYVEYHGDDEDAVSDAIMRAAEIVVACGGDEDATWSAMEPQGIERLRKFRHATPEAVNLTIDQRRRDEPKLTKLGTDMAVPDAHLEAVMAMYRDSLAASGLESVIFGHIGNNHVHVNIIPRNLEEYAKGKELYMEWARKIIAMGGTVSAEHGIGKLKADFLKAMYGEKGIAQMRAVKKVFDPQGLLNPGTLFPVA